ncbi:hypothetical protein Poli38472_002405 [Pythium oligandrum]|uniref:Uncharacterized protein n=1 Tax=Pythium oligandrum TaxID=41045 RepID=A0A8K1FJT2_PYTOL|nr:hypothetical protein Poli38472_002405 [Pythium oligandrum]|eukprot:TMW63464.1 hypothetical protein Poli38472_002405 [Pythium oligandrum]
MADAGKKKSGRVERRGRFTIREIDPESPLSVVDVATYDDETEEETDGRVSDIPETAVVDADVVVSEPSPEPPAAMTEGRDGDVELPPALTMDRSTSDGSFSAAVLAAASTSTDTVESTDDEQVRTMSRSQRVKRKGRFTIIELSSDSPRSRHNSDELEAFSTTTSISMTSSQVAGQSGTVTHSAPASTVLRSESSVSGVSATSGLGPQPPNLTVEPVQRGQSMSRVMEQLNYDTSRMHNTSPLNGMRDLNTEYHHPQMTSLSYGSLPFSRQSSFGLEHLQTYGLGAYAPTPEASPPRLADIFADRRPAIPDFTAARRHSAPRQKLITISADQFLQQQNTIASLIRQQQELKQLINVLQEQQQHLMSIPMQLNELKLEQALSDAQQEHMREAYMQVSALSRANDALQSILSEAEHDARERTMEIESLSEENDELRHRCAILERKYIEERKLSFALDQELKQTRMAWHYARHGSEPRYVHPIKHSIPQQHEGPTQVSPS